MQARRTVENAKGPFSEPTSASGLQGTRKRDLAALAPSAEESSRPVAPGAAAYRLATPGAPALALCGRTGRAGGSCDSGRQRGIRNRPEGGARLMKPAS